MKTLGDNNLEILQSKLQCGVLGSRHFLLVAKCKELCIHFVRVIRSNTHLPYTYYTFADRVVSDITVESVRNSYA